MQSGFFASKGAQVKAMQRMYHVSSTYQMTTNDRDIDKSWLCNMIKREEEAIYATDV